jgi:hypothetical protein
VEPFGLDPETALKLIQMLLRGAGYFFVGFALLGLSTYVVFLCLEIFASQPRAKTRIARVPQPIGCAFVVEQTHDLVPVETPILSEEAIVTGEEVLCEGRIRVDFPGTGIGAHHRPLGIDASNA